jgi:hypothetical protein
VTTQDRLRAEIARVGKILAGPFTDAGHTPVYLDWHGLTVAERAPRDPAWTYYESCSDSTPHAVHLHTLWFTDDPPEIRLCLGPARCCPSGVHPNRFPHAWTDDTGNRHVCPGRYHWTPEAGR